MVDVKEEHKILVMAILVGICCILTLYFHVVLGIGTVFTHFFYIPIILAALWWKRKGLAVAIFLAVLLILSHIFVRTEVVTANDYLRVLMFIVIAIVVAALSERIAKAQEKTAHLNAILRSIRNVNQLIVREKNRDRMIQKACESLIETRGYHSAWIALVDENHGFITAAEAGLGESFAPAIEMMERGEFTRCGQNALEQSGIMIVKDVAAACADCPLGGIYDGRAGMTVRLEYRDMIYGILSVSSPAEMVTDADEQSLFKEVAGDIALALRDMELEEARKRAEEALQRFNEELELKVEERTRELRKERDYTRHLIESSPDVQIILDEEGMIMDVNEAFEKVAGKGRGDLTGMSIYEYLPKDVTEKAIAEILEKGKVRNIELVANIPGMEVAICNFSGTVFTTPEGESGIYITGRDITKRKRAEERIEHLNSVLKAIRNVNQLVIVEKDRDTLLQKACDALIDTRGYDAVWLGFLQDGETFSSVKGSGFREDFSRFCEHVMSGDYPPCFKNARTQKSLFMLVDKSRECGDCVFKNACTGKEVVIVRLEHAGRLFGVLSISLAPDVAADEEEKELLKEVAGDIALALHAIELEGARKQAEDKIKASLKEKEVLLLEIHHRVRNNLQVVSSLLNMQARTAKDKNTIDVLSESRDRINAMALIHTQLYDSGNLSEINMKGFVDKMVRQMFQSYPVRDMKLTPNVNVADCTLPISIAVPLGLVVNELLTNVFKHAFVNRKEGKIEVSLCASKEGEVCLTVSDDDVGLPEGFDVNTTKTLGLHVVKILVEDQLRGKLEVVSDKGTTFKIEFRIVNNELAAS